MDYVVVGARVTLLTIGSIAALAVAQITEVAGDCVSAPF